MIVKSASGLERPTTARLATCLSAIALSLFSTTLSASRLSASSALAGDVLQRPYFEENKGQLPGDVRYSARLKQFDAAVMKDGSLLLASSQNRGGKAVRVRLGQASSGIELTGSELAEFRTNYFRGTDPQGHFTDVPSFGRVTAQGLYSGIDLAYHISSGRLEFDYEVKPGANPAEIQLEIEGGTAELSKAGDLEIAAAEAKWLQHRPVAFQSRGTKRIEVRCKYRLAAPNRVVLELGDYDRSLPLTIDPIVDYSSYLGGGGNDYGRAVRIGPDGYVYVAGDTTSSNFPAISGVDSTLGGADDAFVAKINPATGKLVYATYLGGGGSDWATGLAIDSSGSAFVTGNAESRFPTTSGAYQTSTSSTAGFVTKLSAAGNALIYSTLIAGTSPKAIEVDSQGRAAITGTAGLQFSTSTGALQTSFGGSPMQSGTSGDAFALMLNANGSALVFGTYFGAADEDVGRAIAIDVSGRVVIAGKTSSTNLPMVGAIQSTSGGLYDGFIAAISPTGNSLEYSTYIGGSGSDEIDGLAVDPFGNLVVSGRTQSDNLPTLNALMSRSSLRTNGGTDKTFIAKLGVSPLRLAFSTYAGTDTTCCDLPLGTAVDAAGEIYVFGLVNAATMASLRTVHPFISTSRVSAKLGTADNADAYFLTSLSRDGRRLVYQTLLGGYAVGMGAKYGAINARGAGEVAIIGSTEVGWHPITAGATQATIANAADVGILDTIVMSLGANPPALDLTTGNQQPVANSPVMLTATSYNGAGGTVTFYDGDTVIGSASLVEGIASYSATFAAGVRRLKAAAGTTESAVVLLPVTLTTP